MHMMCISAKGGGDMFHVQDAAHGIDEKRHKDRDEKRHKDRAR